MVFKKKVKFCYRLKDIGRDTIVNKILTHYNIQNGLLFFNILCANPIDYLTGILAAKLGLSKIVVTLIIAFLI